MGIYKVCLCVSLPTKSADHLKYKRLDCQGKLSLMIITLLKKRNPFPKTCFLTMKRFTYMILVSLKTHLLYFFYDIQMCLDFGIFQVVSIRCG